MPADRAQRDGCLNAGGQGWCFEVQIQTQPTARRDRASSRRRLQPADWMGAVSGGRIGSRTVWMKGIEFARSTGAKWPDSSTSVAPSARAARQERASASATAWALVIDMAPLQAEPSGAWLIPAILWRDPRDHRPTGLLRTSPMPPNHGKPLTIHNPQNLPPSRARHPSCHSPLFQAARMLRRT